MIAIVDYRAGNLTSVRLAFEAGLITGRDITFEGSGELDLDVDSVTYVSVLFGSEF